MTTPTLPPTPSTIANLPLATTPLSGNEFVPISQGGVTKAVAANGFTIVGPQGPTGPTGATGPQGPAGGSSNIATGIINYLAYYNTTTSLAGLATINNGILVTNGSAVPSIATAIPSGVTSTTQSFGNSSTLIATTAFVNQGGLTLGTSTATTQSAADSSTKVATTAFVNGTALTLASGTTAVTQSIGDNSTKVATTAFVIANTAMVLLSSQTINSSTASVQVTSGINSTYSHYVWEISNLTSVSGGVDAYITVQQGGVFVGGTSYQYAGHRDNTAGSNSSFSSNGSAQFIPTASESGVDITQPSTIRFEFWKPSLAINLNVIFDSWGGASFYYARGGGAVVTSAVTTGIKLAMSSGNIATCQANLYGVI